MECRYCEQYFNSATRMDNEHRFCPSVLGMVFATDKTCDKFSAANSFWCVNTNCWIDTRVCANRQNKEMDDCKKCRQKTCVLEVRRSIGRSNGSSTQSQPKKILIRREAA
jgi:hypothetical protein